MTWDPADYLRRADERSRPFFDLLARVGAQRPRVVADLGCGPGNLTRTLSERWPTARVIGVDSSPQMLARARTDDAVATTTGSQVSWVQADLREWQPKDPIDVCVSSAALQWVPQYLDQLPRLVRLLAPSGWLAIQVPQNHDEPLHRILAELIADPEFAPQLAGVARTETCGTQRTADLLLAVGCSVDAWTTTYLHLLDGPDPVFEWIASTGARPTLQALSGDLRQRFVDRYKQRLRAAYPRTPHGTWLPFPRSFVVAQRH